MGDKTSVVRPKGQISIRAKGQVNCSFHSKEIFQLYCVTCRELACIKCVSSIHRGHNLDNLKELVPQKKNTILNFIDTLESTKAEKFQQSLTSVEEKLAENSDNFEKLSTAAKSQAEKLKKQIDDHLLKKLSTFKANKQKNEKLLRQFKKDIHTRKERLDNFLKCCKDTVQAGTDIQVHDIEKEVDTYQCGVSLSEPVVQVVSFTPNLHPLPSIEQAFGVVTTEQEGSENSIKQQPLMAIASDSDLKEDARSKPITKHRAAKPKPEIRTKEKKYVKPLFPQDQQRNMQFSQTRIIASFRSPSAISDLDVINKDAWTCCGCLNNITLISNRGKMKRDIMFNDMVVAISVSPTTRNCWIYTNDEKITEITPTRTVHRFNITARQLNSICVTRDEHILIGQSGVLRKLTTNGKTVLKTTTSSSGQPLCVSPCRMSECKITGNIAMVDNEDHVLVIDKDFKEFFRYHGPILMTRQTTAQKWNPVDVAYDNTGNLVVCDSDGIHLINGDGTFLRQLYKETSERSYFHGVCVDDTDTLWIASHDFHVTLLRYT